MNKNDAHSTAVAQFDAARSSRATREPVVGFDRWLLEQAMNFSGQPPFSVVLWNGAVAWRPRGASVATLHIHDRRALLGLLINPERLFGDYYTDGRLEVDGSLVDFFQRLYEAKNRANPPGSWRRVVNAWINRPRTNTMDTARDNIHRHYDIGNAFYRLWLDERMVYTCAYYAQSRMSLAEAQVAKLDPVCRKLELQPGQHVVEAGCGWGALALHMARHYGVTVRAYNISASQIAHARERARSEGLADRVEFVEDDYRNIDGDYDAFVSVGMLEDVGVENYHELGCVMKRVLRKGGRGLLHSIGRNHPDINNAWIERRIFPGSRPPSLSEMTAIFEPNDFSVLDVENLRLHYARTCADWLDRYEQVAEPVQEMYDGSFVRAWRLYLAGSVAAFSTGTLQLFQVVFAHADDHHVPMTREHLYRRG